MVAFRGVISAFLLVLGVPLSAMSETLADAIAAGYANNPALEVQRQQTDVAQSQLEEARSLRRPTVNLSGSVGYESVDSDRPFASQSGNAGDRPVARAGLESVLPLYTGGRISAGIRQAQAGIGAAEAELEAARQDLMLNIVTTYVDVLRDREAILIRENSIALLKEQVRASQDRFDVGEVTRTDVAQSEARLEGGLAARAAAQATLEGSLAVYQLLVGQAAGDLAPVPPAPVQPQDLEAAMQTALTNNPSLERLRFNEQAAAESVERARSDLRPQVSIVGAATIQETYDERFQDTSVSATARATVPLYQGGLVQSQLRSAKLRRQQARLQIDNAEREIRAQVASAWYGVIAAEQAIIASQRRVDAAEIAYDGAQAELSVGTRTTLDVLDQEQQLLEAQLALIGARRDAYVSAHQLQRAMGILGR